MAPSGDAGFGTPVSKPEFTFRRRKSRIASVRIEPALDLLDFAHDLIRKVCQLFGIMRNARAVSYTPRTPSSLLLVLDVAADDVGDIVVLFFLGHDEGGIVDRFVLDVVLARDLLAALRLRVGIFQRDQL